MEKLNSLDRLTVQEWGTLLSALWRLDAGYPVETDDFTEGERSAFKSLSEASPQVRKSFRTYNAMRRYKR